MHDVQLFLLHEMHENLEIQPPGFVLATSAHFRNSDFVLKPVILVVAFIDNVFLSFSCNVVNKLQFE
jgi:hypothetical protein